MNTRLTEPIFIPDCPDSPWHPPQAHHAFGVVVIDCRAGRVLLRQPSFDPTGQAWTFAHALPMPGESPASVAVMEGRDQFGHDLEIFSSLSEWFCGRHLAKWFFLARVVRPLPAGPNWETRLIRWFAWEDAATAIAASPVTVESDGDGRVLAAARDRVDAR